MVVINASILLFTGSFSLNPTIGEMRMSQNTMILRQQYADMCPKSGNRYSRLPRKKAGSAWPDPSAGYCPSFFFSGRYFFSIDATIT